MNAKNIQDLLALREQCECRKIEVIFACNQYIALGKTLMGEDDHLDIPILHAEDSVRDIASEYESFEHYADRILDFVKEKVEQQ